MKTIRYFLSCLFIALSIHSIQSNAQDIDLYSSPAKVNLADYPNVLFIVDNAANWNSSAPACTYADTGGSPSLNATTGGVEQCALVNAINALEVDTVNVGIMVYNKNGMDTLYGCNSSGTGGCLMYPLTFMNAINRADIITKIKAWSGNNQQSSNGATAQGMQEAWAYYAGKKGMSGTTYTSPALGGCQKNYAVFIGNAFGPNGGPNDASAAPGAKLNAIIDANAALSATEKALLKTTFSIPSGAYGMPPANNSCGTYTMGNHTDTSGLYADEWARYMRSTDLVTGSMTTADKKIITYTIGALGSNCKPDFPALLTSMARNGGGKYFPTSDATEIQQAMKRIFNEVQAVNSVFASSSLPVSVNAQGTYLNQIYMGMFRPDENGQPRWFGNLKQYKFIYDPVTRILQLADATGTSAINGTTGFMSPDAASFWNCSSASNAKYVVPYTATLPTCSPAEPTKGFWFNRPDGQGGAYDLPDGQMVEKGGAAMVMRLANLTDDYAATPGSLTNPRKLYTYCPGGTCAHPSNCSSTPTDASCQLSNTANVFDQSNAAITNALLGTGSVTISSIFSKATVQPTKTESAATGAPVTVSITNFAKSGNTVTATVSATDLANLPVDTRLKIATGKSKYDCNPCAVASVDTVANTFTYNLPGGSGTPSVPYTATVYTNFVKVTRAAHGLQVGQMLTFSNCGATLYTELNDTIGTITTRDSADLFTVATAVTPVGTGANTVCKYTPNTATVTTASNHNLPGNATVTIAGATPVGYNGSWTITVTGATTFTYQYTSLAPLADFTGAATVTSSAMTREALTRWVRGEDNYGDEASLCPPGTTVTAGTACSTFVNIRPSVHGDVLHSRPAVINYGGTKGVVVFYGSNDGVFRAVNGNQANPTGSTFPAPGGELWGFIPSEFYGSLKRLHDNSPIVKMWRSNGTGIVSTDMSILPTPVEKGYFADGSTGVYQLINSDGTTQTAHLYITMRRGGRLIYALDVSDPTNPKFLWKHDNTDPGFSELGQTWSQPKVAMVAGRPDDPVLIFGAGYDPAEDSEPPATDTMGRGIFILDAKTGALLWSATPNVSPGCTSTKCELQVSGMNYSIPSDITLLDRNNDGKIDRLYVGDVGGNIWRVDLEPAGNTPDKWQVEKLAALGCNTGTCASGTTPRKFLYPPEVISVTGYDAVFAGSGDREHPLYDTTANSAYNVTNRIYMLKDTDTDMNGSGLITITEQPGSVSPNNLFNATSTPYDKSLRGYYITLDTGEKIVNAPLVVAGYVYFGANQPDHPDSDPSTCEETLGEAKSYRLSPFSGTVKEGEWESGGLPPSPVAGVVNVEDASGHTIQVPFCIGCGVGEDDDDDEEGGSSSCNASALAACRPDIDVSTSRQRTYWYMDMD